MENFSNLRVNVTGEDGAIVESYTHPRVVLTIIAIQAGMSTEEVMALSNVPDEKLQALVNQIGLEFIVPTNQD